MRLLSRSFLFLVAMGCCAFAVERSHEAKVTYLDNGVIRVGADLALGGAITWLSQSGSEENLINSYDWGRQVQMSYYGGPVPFIPEGKEVAPQWRGLGWNPIQSGDEFGHRSAVLEQSSDNHTIHIKCTPMQWPLNDVPGECAFESWIELDGTAVQVRARLTNMRRDHTQYPARMQEMPAVYTNAPFSHLVSYTGERPFREEATVEIEAKPPPAWNHWLATERWAALLNDKGWGLGVWNPGCVEFLGGFNGRPGTGDAKSPNCGYLAPGRPEILDASIVHEYRYELIVGTLAEIRARACRGRDARLPAWRFVADRQGWYYREARDGGWPIAGELAVQFEAGDPQMLSPLFFCRAEDAPVLILEAAFDTHEPSAQVYWKGLGEKEFAEERCVTFPVRQDRDFHEYRVRLADSPVYKGGIVALRIDPANASAGSVRLRTVRFENTER